MKKLFWIFFLIVISTNLLALNALSRQELGLAPFKIEAVQNRHGTYYIVLLKGDSEILVLDSEFNPMHFLKETRNDGINDCIIKDERLYCFGFFSGRIIVFDISGEPSKWKLEKKMSTEERLITGAISNNILGVLGMDSVFLLIDMKDFKIKSKIKLPVEALSVIADKDYFYVSLFYNYNLLENNFDTKYGLLAITPSGNIHKRVSLGKRPSYMLQDMNNLYVVNYLDGTLDVLSKGKLEKEREFKLGKLPNFPIMEGRNIWIACTGSDEVYLIELEKGTVKDFKTQGSAPLKVLIAGEKEYVLSVASGTIEEINNPISVPFKLQGYPIDAVANSDKIAVLLQEDWLSGSVLGSLVTLKQ
ncbi:hypothetical protein AT15_07525 [Kosmotoga arenicorallina S304]|uniref:Uncharacterized protein n=1 Tax=Kosmotoga arenicorallina S304 TaxID=1453497 RepID=A0A176K2S5_9BACT|nr:hypothetical protein [Kosmotoga arenicorallina]OAA31338.1 hypothetical protein AT15_07525 [Kosmotoga arenicorallina S304]